VKNLNATVHVDGDRWRADKYDTGIQRLIQHDHAFHDKRRRTGPRPPR
jgi:hypothetical protein